MGKSAPAAPDPAATAAAQAQTNTETARVQAALNRGDTVTPFGTITNRAGSGRDYGAEADAMAKSIAGGATYDGASWFRQAQPGASDGSSSGTPATFDRDQFIRQAQASDPGADHYTTTITLSPEQQRLYGLQTGVSTSGLEGAQTVLDNARKAISSPIDTSGLASWATPGSPSSPLVNRLDGTAEGIVHGVGGAGEGIRNDYWDAGQNLRSDYWDAGQLEQLGQKDFSADRQRVEDAIMSRLDPAMARDREGKQAELAAMGFGVNSEGYDRSMDELNRAKTDARMQAVLAGGQEQSRLFGLDLSRVQADNAARVQSAQVHNASLDQANTEALQNLGAHNDAVDRTNQAQGQGFTQRAQDAALTNAAQAQGFGQVAQNATFRNGARSQELAEALQLGQAGNATRAQQLAELLQLRAQPVNEASSLLGLGPGVQVPNASQLSGVGVGAPDLQGLISGNYKAQAGQVAADNQTTGAALSAIAMAAAMAFSDRRMKDDVKRVGELDNGLPVYSFRYKGSPKTQIGLMAQDVEQENPGAVGHLFGMKMVDYAKAAA